MTKNYRFLTLLICMLFIVSCNDSDIVLEKFETINDQIKEKYAPDKRVDMYNIVPIISNNGLLLKGETDNLNALNELKKSLEDQGIEFIDQIDFLPNKTVGTSRYAVINNSVANIRSNPRHSAELATQVLLGTGVKMLKIEGSFYLVQVPDGYISWVDHGGVVLMNENEYF